MASIRAEAIDGRVCPRFDLLLCYTFSPRVAEGEPLDPFDSICHGDLSSPTIDAVAGTTRGRRRALNPYAKFLGKSDPLEVAAKTPARIGALIRGLSPRQLAWRPAPGKWSIREIINHLTESEMVMCCRSRWIAFEENPTLVPFDQEKWAKGWVREQEHLEETMERFRLLRRSQLRLFRGASPRDLKRTGFHLDRGTVTLRVQLEWLAGHDLNHLEQIQRLATRLRAKG